MTIRELIDKLQEAPDKDCYALIWTEDGLRTIDDTEIDSDGDVIIL